MKFLSIITTILTLGLSLTGITFLQKREIKAISLDSGNSPELQEKLDGVVLKIQDQMPTLGFDNLLADWNYLNFIQYFGDRQAREITGYTLSPLFFEIITKNDPRFIRAILLLSSANSIFANSPISTVRILNETLERVTPEFDPLTPYIWVYKGVDEMIYLGKIKDAQNSYEMASRWALATKPPDELLAKRSQETATFLEKNPNSRNARIGAWTNILIGSINEATREIAIQEIKALGGTVKITADGQLLIDFPEKD